VHIVFPAGSSILEVLADLRDDLPHLRAEVASAITRKRTPELSFVPAGAEAAGDV
jgi:ribosome-binding factor A